jgi:hypothetical protein
MVQSLVSTRFEDAVLHVQPDRLPVDAGSIGAYGLKLEAKADVGPV